MRQPWSRVAACLFLSWWAVGCGEQKSADIAPQPAAQPSMEAKIPPAAQPPLADDAPRPEPAAVEKPSAAPKMKLKDGSKGGGFGAAQKEAAPEEAQEEAPIETWQRAKASANVSRMMIGDTESLPLDEMNVSVRVDGYRARVILDLYYPNTTGRSVEGNFNLKLPEEATPFFFAFGEMAYQARSGAHAPTINEEEARAMGFLPDLIAEGRAKQWTNPKIARMVPKEEAAYAYRETVRGNVDPALAEWAGAGVFNARVFPLAPNKTHRVVVGYDVDLVHAGADLELKVELPEGVETMTVDLSVAQLPGVTVTTTPQLTGLSGDGRTFYRLVQPKREVVVRQAKAGAQLLVGEDALTGAYFASRLSPALESDDTSSASQATFLVDVSLSANPEQFNIWLKLMEAILTENRPQLARFSVIFFNIEGFAWRPGLTENTAANVEALMKYADTLSLEGATDLGAALAQAVKQKGDIFLLSDGAATWGESEAFALSAALQQREGSFYAYSTGMAGADLAMLRHLTREGRGAVFSVVGEAQIKEASSAHRKAPWTLVDVTVDGGSDLLLAGRPQALFPGQDLLLVGRGTPKPGAKATLKLKQGREERSVEVPLGVSISSDLAPRLYGQVATAQLEDLGAAVEDDAKAYARHFRVTGRTTSLLMLERESDYLRFGIKAEDDAGLIKKHTVADKVSEFLTTITASLTDPKKAFLLWEQRLAVLPGVKMALPAEVLTAVEALPSSAFAVTVPPLSCKGHTKAALNKDIAAMLEKHALDYDALTADAAARRGLSSCDALKTLSSLVEESPGDSVLARDIAYQAIEMKLPGQAYALFKRVLTQRSYEPQTYHAIAQVLASLGKSDLAMTYFELGLAGQWDRRFGDFWAIISLDYLRFLRGSSGKLSKEFAALAKTRITELSEKLDISTADLVVTIAWNTDGTDMDLHVTEPSGEECYYGFTETYLGGSLTRDVTQGYGPEMYVMKEATSGQYKVRAHSYATDRNRMSARTKILATVYQKFGTPQERVTRKVITLDDEAGSNEDELREILTLQLSGKPLAPKELNDDELQEQAESARNAILSILEVNSVQISEAVEEKLDGTNDPKFLKRWMSRAININSRNAESEFKLLLSEKTANDFEVEAERLRDAITAIFEANGVVVNDAASEKLDATRDVPALRRLMQGALTAKYADTLLLGKPGDPDDAPDPEDSKDASSLQEALLAILVASAVSTEDGELPGEVTKPISDAVKDGNHKTLRAWMLLAPSITSIAAAKRLFVYTPQTDAAPTKALLP